MALNRIFSQISKIYKVKKNMNTGYNETKSRKYLFYPFLIVIFFSIFILVFNLINQKNKKEIKNFNTIVESNEFSNLGDYLLSKINSPYKEIKYQIKTNDSIEKILKKFQIDTNDIKKISNNLKQNKLTNIYSG